MTRGINLNEYAASIKKLQDLSFDFEQELSEKLGNVKEQIEQVRLDGKSKLELINQDHKKRLEEIDQTLRWDQERTELDWQKNEEWIVSVESFINREFGIKHMRDDSFQSKTIQNKSIKEIKSEITELLKQLEKAED